jgi:hypothetical protein
LHLSAAFLSIHAICVYRFDKIIPGPQGEAGAGPVNELGLKLVALVQQYIQGEKTVLGTRWSL